MSEGGDLNAYVFLLIVNYALCAELALKAAYGDAVGGCLTPDDIVRVANFMSTVHGHNLPEMFASLQTAIQTDIKSEFLAATGEDLPYLLPVLELRHSGPLCL